MPRAWKVVQASVKATTQPTGCEKSSFTGFIFLISSSAQTEPEEERSSGPKEPNLSVLAEKFAKNLKIQLHEEGKQRDQTEPEKERTSGQKASLSSSVVSEQDVKNMVQERQEEKEWDWSEEEEESEVDEETQRGYDHAMEMYNKCKEKLLYVFEF